MQRLSSKYRTLVMLCLGALVIALVVPAGAVRATFSEEAKLVGALDANESGGFSVDISGDTAVVGSIYDHQTRGSVDVFRRTVSGWVQEAHLAAEDGEVGDHFGISVAVDGDTVLIGAYQGNNDPYVGKAYVYTRSGTTWSLQETLQHLHPDVPAAAFDQFGSAVALEGDTAVIGAYGEGDGSLAAAGTAYVFTRDAGTWTKRAQLFAGDRRFDDQFGKYQSIAISGNTVVIGALLDDVDGRTNQGSAWVFEGSGGTWSPPQMLTDASGAANDMFGHSVAVAGDTILVGSFANDIGSNVNQGSVEVFAKTAGTWTRQSTIVAPDGTAGDVFGHHVALSGDIALIGAYGRDVATAADQGLAYVFTRAGTAWTHQETLSASDGTAGDGFGYSLALSGDDAVIAALNDDVAGVTNHGSAYIFRTLQPEVCDGADNDGDGSTDEGFADTDADGQAD